ncbi:MAG: T9SS type A sorting domain-containing protein, partial [Flavobacteriales bacterium]
VLQPFDTLCASGASYPLDGYASPAGGTWSGPGVVDNVFTPFENGSFSLTYSIPCPPSASQTITVINSPTITLLSGDPTDMCALDPLLYSVTPAGGVWGGLAGPDGSVARDCSVRPISGPAVYIYTAPNGECVASAGFSGQLQVCAPIDLGADITLCTSSDTMEVVVQGPSQGGASLTGCDHTLFTPPSLVTGYFIPGNHVPGEYLIIGNVSGSGYCPGTDTLVVTLIAAPDAGMDSTLAICGNADPFSLFSVLGGTPQADGTWSHNGVPHSGIINPAVDNGGVYTYEVGDEGPCSVDTASVTIAVTVPPSATAAYNDSPYCAGMGMASVTHTGTTGGTYTSSPAGLSLNASTGAVALDSSTLGTYTVTYTIAPAGGCSLFQTTASITIAACTADCNGDLGGNALPGTPCDPDDLDYTWSNECICVGPTGVNTTGSPEWFSIHPNPSSGSFQLVPSGTNTGPSTIRVYDALGRLIMKPVQFTGDQPQLLHLDDGHADGVYFLRVARGGENYIMQLMIQR